MAFCLITFLHMLSLFVEPGNKIIRPLFPFLIERKSNPDAQQRDRKDRRFKNFDTALKISETLNLFGKINPSFSSWASSNRSKRLTLGASLETLTYIQTFNRL